MTTSPLLIHAHDGSQLTRDHVTRASQAKLGQDHTPQSTTISQRVNTYVYPCRISIEFKVIYDSQMI